MIRLIVLIAAAAALRADSLEDILKRMDAESKKFQSFSANLKQTEYTYVLKESTESTGQIRIKRNKDGLLGVVIFDPPENRIFHFAGRTVEIYYPKAKTEEIYDVGKYQGAMDLWLTLGFDTSGAELRKEYTIKLIGAETVESVPTTHIQLTPRSDQMLKLITTVDLWIPEGKSYPIQEKPLTPSKDYRVLVYSNVKINPPLSNSDFELKVPADVKKIHPAK